VKNASPEFVEQPMSTCYFLIDVNWSIHGKLLRMDRPFYPTCSVHTESVAENMVPRADITTSKMSVMSRQEICWEEEYINTKYFLSLSFSLQPRLIKKSHKSQSKRTKIILDKQLPKPKLRKYKTATCKPNKSL